MSAAATLRQLSSAAPPSGDRKTRNGATRALPLPPPLPPAERTCPPTPPQLPPPPAGFRPSGERSGGSLDAGNATQRPPVAALPAPQSSQQQQHQHQQRVRELAAAAGRGQPASAFVAASGPHFEPQPQPRINRSTEPVVASAAGSPAAPAKTVAIIAAAKESLDSARRSGSNSGSSWQLLPPRHSADTTRAAAATITVTSAVTGGGGGGGGGHLPAPPPPQQQQQRLSDRLSLAAAADNGRSPLAAPTAAAAATAAADATTEDYDDPWREAAAQADAEVAAAALAPQPGHLLVSRLGRLGIRNFDSRDSISTDDCPTDASSMRRSLYSVDTVRCGTPYEGHLSVNADTPASDAPLCSPDSAADDDEQPHRGGVDAARSAATAATPNAAAASAAERQWLRRARWLGGGGGGSEEVALVNGKRVRNEASAAARNAASAAAAAATKHRRRTDIGTESTEYRVGSCWHCLINVPCPSLLTWLSLCLATLGWSVSGYMSASLVKKMLDDSEVQYSWYVNPAIDEICVIVLGVMTVCIGVLFLVVATFSSENMSRYFFNTRAKNRMGRCVNILVLALCYVAVVVWSGICAGIMVPVTVLGIIKMNVQAGKCFNLENLGFTMSTPKNTCQIEALSDQVKEALVTLVICLAFAFVVQLSMVAFLVNVSANIRHLKESRYETYNAGSGGLAQSNPVSIVGGEQRDSAM